MYRSCRINTYKSASCWSVYVIDYDVRYIQCQKMKFICWVSGTFLRMWVVTPGRFQCTFVIFVTYVQCLLSSVFTALKGTNLINYAIQLFLFLILLPAPLLNLAPFFPLGFPTCILVCRAFFQNFSFCNLGSTDYFLMCCFFIYV